MVGNLRNILSSTPFNVRLQSTLVSLNFYKTYLDVPSVGYTLCPSTPLKKNVSLLPSQPVYRKPEIGWYVVVSGINEARR